MYIRYSMFDVNKQKTRCVMLRFYKVTKGRPYTEITQRVYCLRCADGPLLLKHTAVKPPWRDFSTVTDLFSFFLSSYHWACGVRGNIRAVFPVVSSVRHEFRPVFVPLTRNNTIILSLSLSKPFMLFITSCLLTRLKPLSGVKLEKLNWVNNKKCRFVWFSLGKQVVLPRIVSNLILCKVNVMSMFCHSCVDNVIAHYCTMSECEIFCVLCKGIYLVFMCVEIFVYLCCVSALECYNAITSGVRRYGKMSEHHLVD